MLPAYRASGPLTAQDVSTPSPSHPGRGQKQIREPPSPTGVRWSLRLDPLLLKGSEGGVQIVHGSDMVL
jgi:hypothetical protein